MSKTRVYTHRLEPQTPPRAPMLPNTAQASFTTAQDAGLSV